MPDDKKAGHEDADLEFLKLDLERLKFELARVRYRSEMVKWVAIAIGAIVSFVVIDYGRLKLDQARAASDQQLHLIDAYSKATEAAEPEIWKRKLEILRLLATDSKTERWASDQLEYIKNFAALDALYRETLRAASQLVDRASLQDLERAKTRRRFEQLYWADLPFAGESPEVESAMVKFREALMAAEKPPTGDAAWQQMNAQLIELSSTLKNATRASSR